MNANTVPGAVAVVQSYQLEGKLVFEVECRDFDHFKALPSVLSLQGVNCVKCGWSSDSNLACYKQYHAIAWKVA